jgi:hypothetical protein
VVNDRNLRPRGQKRAPVDDDIEENQVVMMRLRMELSVLSICMVSVQHRETVMMKEIWVMLVAMRKKRKVMIVRKKRIILFPLSKSQLDQPPGSVLIIRLVE